MSVPAIELALAAYQRPARLRMLDDAAAAPDVLTLIKIAAGDTTTTNECAAKLNVEDFKLIEACVFYLRGLIAAAGSDPFKLLCLQPNANAAQFTAHKRWLLRWLHPDRNGSAWESGLFNRVATAARALEAHFKSDAPIAMPGSSSPGKPAFDSSKVRFTNTRHPAHHLETRRPTHPGLPVAARPRYHYTPEPRPRRVSLLRRRASIIAAFAMLSALAFFAGRWTFVSFGDLTNLLWRS